MQNNTLLSISDLMDQSGVGFGTSGARGLVRAMTDRVCYAYTKAFLQYIAKAFPGVRKVAIGGDLRPSTPRILAACARAACDAGWECENAGDIPSPALALHGITQGIPTVMVTGSHIPDDRNGIKFNHPKGEISKVDETGIKAESVEIPAGLFTEAGMLAKAEVLAPKSDTATIAYRRRYVEFFGNTALAGLRIGLYQHSTVGRDIAAGVLSALGAQVTALARSEKFIPVDTEAIRPEDHALAKEWCAGGAFDAIVSMDGDADRPLLADEKGEWLRGDVLGILVSRILGIYAIAIPVSCNTAAEKCLSFAQVKRTRIGSPFVIAGMETLAKNFDKVAGYEANGGFLLQTALEENGKTLPALPTRDALLPVIAVLRAAGERKCKVSDLAGELPARYTASDRLKEFPTAQGLARVDEMRAPGAPERMFGELCGAFVKSDETDGLRMEFASGEIVHLRPSGNAPELRCYTECATNERAIELNKACIAKMEAWRVPA